MALLNELIELLNELIIWGFIFQDFILEHYSEEPNKYDDAITELMDMRQVHPNYSNAFWWRYQEKW